MARKTLKQRIALDGGKEIEAELKALGRAGEEAFEKLKAAAKGAAAPSGKLAETMVKLKTTVVKLRTASDRLGKSFSTMGRRLSNVVSTVATVARRMTALSVAALGAAAAIAAVARSGAAAADAAAKTAEGLNLSIEQYTRLRFAAGQSGVSVNQFGAAINSLNTKVATAVKGAGLLGSQISLHPDQWAAAQQATVTAGAAFNKTAKSGDRAAQALKQLGIKLRQTGLQFSTSQAPRTIRQFAAGLRSLSTAGPAVRPTFDILLDLADAFKTFPDGIEEAGLAAAIFGEDLGRRLLPFLNLGSEGIKALNADADRLGATFTELQGKIGTKLIEAQGRLAASIGGLKNQIGLLFAPALTKAADRQTNAIQRHRKALLEGVDSAIPKAVALVEDLVAALSGRDADVNAKWILDIRDAIIAFARDVKLAFDKIIVPAFRGLVAIFDEVAVAVNDVFGTNFTGQSLLIAAAVAQLLGVFSSLGTVVLATTALLVGVLPEALALLQDVVAAIQGRDQDVNAQWVLDVRDAILTFVKDVGTAFTDILFPLFQKLISAADTVADAINFVFRTDISGTSLLIAAVVGKMLGLFRTLAAVLIIATASISLVKTAIGLFAGTVAAIVTGLALLGVTVSALLVGAVLGALVLAAAAFVFFWDDIKEGFSDVIDWITGLFSDLPDTLGGFAELAAEKIISALESVGLFIADLSRKLRNLIAQAAKATFKAAKSALGFSDGGPASSGFSGGGGPLRGPGSKTSDSIRARLSRGEFVIRAAAVDRYGPRLFAALNSLRLPRNPLPGFALGGLVDGITSSLSSLAPAPIPAFAGGGMVASGGQAGRPVILNLDGQKFNLSAEDSVAEALNRTALRQQRASAGRAPRWFGG